MPSDTTPETQSPDATAPGFSSSATAQGVKERRSTRPPSARAQAKFLSALTEYGIVQYACNESGIPRRKAYHFREVNREFALAWDAAIVSSTEMLEHEAARRAKGYEVTTFDKNGNAHVMHVYSDRLLEFVLAARKDDYRVRRVEMTGKDGGAINVTDEAQSIRSKLLHGVAESATRASPVEAD